MKKFISGIFALSLVTLSFSMTSFASEDSSTSWGTQNLSKKEVNYLIKDVGLTEEELNNFPTHILKELISNKAKKLASTTKVVREDGTETTGDIKPNQSLDGGELTLNATAFSVTSDKTGNKKFYLYGSYDWSKSPAWELTDGLSIGYPVTTKWYLPMNNGKVQQHETQYCYRPDNNPTAPWSCSKSTTPVKWDPGVGVGNEIDLVAMPSNNAHKGYIAQYVYVVSSESGTTNVKFQYGHQRWSGSVSFGIYPAGLSIEPNSVSDLIDYGITFSY